MKKVLLGMMIAGLIVANPVFVQACSKEKKSECKKSGSKESTCKISKLKAKVKILWVNKDEFKITDDQLTKIKDIKHEAIKKLIQLKADKDVVMVDLKSAMWSDIIDVDTVNKLIDTKYAAKIKASKMYIMAISAIQNVLSADQRAQWKANCAKSFLADKKICPLEGKGSKK
ncbi:hypothetical protein MNBD_UNCLBAC01-595 [hydrothermal vent metagenome]|uniref:Uncharacterized protein n=1 Tax=hydrothermal vent metagenome TaxID=652676 RepID=A0A3B1DMW5_9ZZZZ